MAGFNLVFASTASKPSFQVPAVHDHPLTPNKSHGLDAHVATGEFPSVEEAVRQLINKRIAERLVEDDDLSWATPLVDEALRKATVAKTISLDEHKARNAARRCAPMLIKHQTSVRHDLFVMT